MNRYIQLRDIKAVTVGVCMSFVAAVPCAAAGDATELWRGDERGFSYFMGVAVQQTRYRETASILPVRSEVKTRSPLLVTGALYALTPNVLASLDNETTFAPQTSTERWISTSPVFAGTPLTDTLLQSNRFRFSESTTRALGHYRLRDQWFGLGGVTFRSQSFRRYGYAAGADQAVSVTAGQTTEETSAEVLLNLGLALETEAVRDQGQHAGVRLMVGVPAWRRVENTSFPDQTFGGKGGWDLTAEMRYSWALHRHVHLGGWLKAEHSRRPADNSVVGHELPRSRLDRTAAGLELLWKL